MATALSSAIVLFVILLAPTLLKIVSGNPVTTRILSKINPLLVWIVAPVIDTLFIKKIYKVTIKRSLILASICNYSFLLVFVVIIALFGIITG